jgi:N-carbamoyl-L-amino-acid hydrolase
MNRIDADRLLGDLATLRSFGASGNGVVRTMFSDIDVAARAWLVERMAEAGLDATIDGVGSVYGRSPNDGPCVVIGSHTDTQPEGGWLDGAMGVLHGLEVARALLSNPATSHLAVDVASWADEEGTYGNFLGSRSFVDTLSDSDWQSSNVAGETVAQVIERLGWAGDRIQLDPARHVAALESHIEQGPHLEHQGLRIGVITDIVGIRAMQIEFRGQQNHAGTTPMALRKDAAMAMFHFCATLDDRLRAAAAERSVWTIGEVTVSPGAQSIVPGNAVITLQFRDADDDVLGRFETVVDQLVAETHRDDGVHITVIGRRAAVQPAPMDATIVDHLAAAAEAIAPGDWTRMPSAAGHDAQVLAPHLPTGMLFIPSIDGISHDFAEDSHHDDIVLGAEVLADAVVRILS